MTAYITARRPADVAREVERWSKRGCRSFVLRKMNAGDVLDLERMGAARYAAGVQADVELEAEGSDFGVAASR